MLRAEHDYFGSIPEVEVTEGVDCRHLVARTGG
jgi:hypothetical protein